tara:strand:+ start:14287 stop:18339 length:4053 start_codon:yes stop_codon:yes gene_type:complete
MSNDHDWLNLVEVSGPFLAVPVLKDVFPQGLEALSSGHPQRLRRTYEEWREAVEVQDIDLTELHAAWVKEVLSTALEIDDAVLRSDDTLPASLTMMMPEHGTTITPDLAVVNPTNADEPLLLIHVYAPDTNLEATHRFGGLAITPADRMVSLLRATGCPIGLVTNGERWMLVHAPVGAVAGFASWYARLWGQEPETLRAFVSLLGVRRFFGPDDGRLTALYERSLKHQDDVTEALGEQVRRAVEVLVQSLDRANQDRNQELLRDVEPRELYEASLTVMMRLVFLLAAEERGLLLLGDPRYDSFYAISSLRMQLRSDSEEILERRRSAWSRLLGLFRGVFGGIEHPTLRLPALGGSLFDPDRYPFLEGRKKGTFWRTDPAEPLPIDDRTVLLLLEAIQTFQGRALSYRALDVEQIGHVYEGLLERTVKRVDDVTLELDGGSKAKSPRITLGEMESARLDGTSRVVELIKERSERSEPAIQNALERQVDDRLAARLLTVCRGDVALRDRILPVANLLRTDPWGYPLVHHKGAFVVVLGADRRESGTHYTPKSLTEKIVEETLTPVAYRGPAEGEPPQEWELKSAEALLDLKICDPAMGSGAFLVQACRWLSDRLVEAWSITEAIGGRIDSEGGIIRDPISDGFEPLSPDTEERAVVARRLVAERCLYGVDRNPLAVELAKLSLWLTTMSKGRPFGFLDHNLRSGDSLLGIYDLDQLIELNLNPRGKSQLRLFGRSIRSAIDRAFSLRSRLRETPIRDIHDVEAMAALDVKSREELELPTRIADAFVGIALAEERAGDRSVRFEELSTLADAAANNELSAKERMQRAALRDLAKGTQSGLPAKPLHWPLNFPEVFLRENSGFDAIVGNPPFLGNRLWKSALGERLQRQCEMVLGSPPGKIDLCVVFHRRAVDLIRKEGTYGLLATSNIAEGSAISVGLGKIVEQGAIYSADKGMAWPGTAAVEVALVYFFKGDWEGHCKIAGDECGRIGPRLSPQEINSWELKALARSISSFEGVNNSKGLSFVVSPGDDWFDPLKNEANSLLRPYVTGDDILSSALKRIDRWALDILDLELEEIAAKWPIAHQFLEEFAKPTRTPDALKSYKGLIDRWWQFWNHRADQMKILRRQEKFIAFPKVTKYPNCMRASSSWIYTNKIVLIDDEREDYLAIFKSSAFRGWLQHLSGGKIEGRLSLSISESIAKYAIPDAIVSMEGISAAERLDELSVELAERHNFGLTEVMNWINSPERDDATVSELRDLMAKIDEDVFVAYGWTDLNPKYEFRPFSGGSVNDPWRWALSDQTLSEVIRRLTELNRQRYEEEVAQGLHGKKKPAAKSRAPKAGQKQSALDLGDLPNF